MAVMIRLFMVFGVVALASLARVDSILAEVRVDGLKCEYRVNPLGIDRATPRLSWAMQSSERGQMQTAYRILVASSRENLKRDTGDLWDSGKIVADGSVNIEYAGAALRNGAECFWKVKTWDRSGKESVWSTPAFWSMGLLTPGDWKARWIGMSDRPKVPPFVKGQPAPPGAPAPFFRKEFTLDKPVKRAVLYITARGMYEAFLDGKRVGDAVLAPGYTDYRMRIQYQEYDVTALLKKGENAIGAMVGDGWYCGYIGIIMLHDFYGDQTGLLADLRIEYTDGTSQAIATDSSWKCANGPILNSDMLLGETYDARREMPGWDRPGFDDSAWKPADVLDSGTAALVAQPSQQDRVVRYLKPVSVKEPKSGVYVFDMGQNFAGWARLKVRGTAGTTVTLRFAEMINPDGAIYTENLRNARSTDTYTLRGGGDEVYEPHFTFHGFRYVEVTGYPGKPGLDAVTGCVITADAPVAGTFACSNPMVNKLFSNINWGQMSNFVSIPTDCPQRDERQGWMGDAQIFFRTATYNRDVSAFFTKWMDDVVDAQLTTGAFSDTSPYCGHGLGTEGTPAWGDAGIIVPWRFYEVYGDTLMLAKNYRAMEKWMDWLKADVPDYIPKNRHNYGDWLNVDQVTAPELVSTAYWAYDASLMARIASILGRNADAERYEALFHMIRDAFQKEFVSPDGRIKGETQTSYLFALAFDLLPADLRQKAAGYLVENIEQRGWHLSTGFLGVLHLCPVLVQMGYPDVAYRILDNDTYPSWGYSIKYGATTIWERWNGWTSENGFFEPGMNSFNHYSLGSVGEWLYSGVAGIDLDPAVPAYKRSIIRPVVGGGLTHAEAAYTSLYGKIASGWKLDGDTFRLDVSIPANTIAIISVPSKEGTPVTESGKPAENAAGLKFVKYENGYSIYEAGSGTYSFASTMKK